MIGTKIKEVRTKKGMQQNEVAEIAGISYVMLGLIERGQANPSITMLEKIAAAMEMELVVTIRKRKKTK